MTEIDAAPSRSAHGDFSVGQLEACRDRIAVIVPAREEADGIAGVVAPLVALRELGAVAEVLVIDAASADGTARIAADAGATVLQREDLLGAFGPALGKGDAVWRGLSATAADIVCVVDADLADFDERYVLGLCGPLVSEPPLQFVKGTFRRPFADLDGTRSDDEGGRVTQLTAKPLLGWLHPELNAFSQPLSGQWAARRELLLDLPIWTGYALEICQLLDVHARVGSRAMAESDLGTLVNRHQSLRLLGAMAECIVAGVMARHEGSATALERAEALGVVRRPPLRGVLGGERRSGPI